MRGPLASSVQGLPRVASTCWWMVDRNEFFQLELFQFERPLARLMAHDFRPCDIGYTRIGVWVADFDRTLTRLERLGSSPLSDPSGPPGRVARACATPTGCTSRSWRTTRSRAPDSTPSRSACPVAVRSVTLSVPDLARSEAFFSRGLGLRALRCRAASPRARGAVGAGRRADAQQRVRRRRASSSSSCSISIRSGGRARPDYRISDQGILNIAFGARSRRDHGELYRRARAAGARENCRPVHLPGGASCTSTTRTSSRSSCCGCPRLGQALGIHAAAGGASDRTRRALKRTEGRCDGVVARQRTRRWRSSVESPS